MNLLEHNKIPSEDVISKGNAHGFDIPVLNNALLWGLEVLLHTF